MSDKPDFMAQFKAEEIASQELLQYINSLQLAMIQLQRTVFEMRQRELERQFPELAK